MENNRRDNDGNDELKQEYQNSNIGYHLLYKGYKWDIYTKSLFIGKMH